jgi:Tfp pilus assembly protein PilX
MTNNIRTNQKGIVSITVTMMIMIVISLMTLGFARLMQREQRAALDRQLGVQAFYSAESGVNDALSAIRTGKQINKTDCNGGLDAGTGDNSQLDSDNINSYTCLTVASDLPDVRVQAVGPDNGKLVVMQQQTPGSTLDKIVVEWERGAKTNFGASVSSLVPFASYPSNSPDILRVVVFKRKSAKLFEHRTYYVTPTAGGGLVSYGDLTQDGKVIAGKCDSGSEYKCRLEITDSFSTPERKDTADGRGDTIVGVSTLYNQAGTDVRIVGSSGGSPVLLSKTQYRIDSNGRANDVLKRIQVRVSRGGIEDYIPERALESTSDICKRFMVAPGEVERSDSIPAYDGGGAVCLP